LEFTCLFIFCFFVLFFGLFPNIIFDLNVWLNF
jgi:hypothetical protein